MSVFGVTVASETGEILVNQTSITQAEAIKLATSLVEAVEMSRDRNQLGVPSYYDSVNIIRRMESPLGRAKLALKEVF